MAKRSPAKTTTAPAAPPEIRPGQSIELLKALHILTVDGRMNQDSRRKLKQVYHLLQFIEPLVAKTVATRGGVNVVDFGAGKSYLGFLLYDLVLKSLTVPYHVYAIETRAELNAAARALAVRLGFAHMRFLEIAAADAIHAPELAHPRIDIVTALHACDTATDDAIAFALARKAQYIVLVPCCQAEVAAVLRKEKSHATAVGVLSELWRHPIRTREFGAHLTNVLRSLQLEASGYAVTVTELVGFEHSMKNELILAERKGIGRAAAKALLDETLRAFGLESLRGRFAPAGSVACPSRHPDGNDMVQVIERDPPPQRAAGTKKQRFVPTAQIHQSASSVQVTSSRAVDHNFIRHVCGLGEHDGR